MMALQEDPVDSKPKSKAVKRNERKKEKRLQVLLALIKSIFYFVVTRFSWMWWYFCLVIVNLMKRIN